MVKTNQKQSTMSLKEDEIHSDDLEPVVQIIDIMDDQQ
jgi:hypothetical protein